MKNQPKASDPAPEDSSADRARHGLVELELLAEARDGWVMPKEPSPEGKEVVERIRRRREAERPNQ